VEWERERGSERRGGGLKRDCFYEHLTGAFIELYDNS